MIIIRYLNIARNLCSVANISKYNKMNMDKCYFRYIQADEAVDITFLSNIKDSVRQFNFSRKPTETLQTLFLRISTNMQKAIKKAYKKKAPEASDVNVQLMDLSDDSINEQSTCLDLFKAVGPVHLKINNHIYEAVFNPPWVSSLQLPHIILSGFPVYPEHVTVQYANIDLCLFKWYKGCSLKHIKNELNESQKEWALVKEGVSYTPTAQDIGMTLKVECTPGKWCVLCKLLDLIT